MSTNPIHPSMVRSPSSPTARALTAVSATQAALEAARADRSRAQEAIGLALCTNRFVRSVTDIAGLEPGEHDTVWLRRFLPTGAPASKPEARISGWARVPESLGLTNGAVLAMVDNSAEVILVGSLLRIDLVPQRSYPWTPGASARRRT